MRWQSIILFLNRICPVGCPTCSAGCTPPKRTEELSPAWLEKFLARTKTLPFDGYVVWTGGEPFLSMESLSFGLKEAASLGYKSEILTSGVWFQRHPEWIDAIPHGTRLRISLDDEHQRTIPLSTITGLIGAALTKRIQVNFTFRDVPGGRLAPSDYVNYLRTTFPEFHETNKSNSRWIHYLPTIPPGDKSWTPAGEASAEHWRKSCPVDFKDLVIGEDGRVYPCCGHFATPQFDRLSAGDPLVLTWQQIRKKLFADDFFTTLRSRGPAGVCADLGWDPQKWGSGQFQSPCHLCQVLFRQPEVWPAVSASYSKKSAAG